MSLSPRIVLVGTTHPGNIGATARAMKTMGFGQLWLVAPECALDEVAFDRAAGAKDVVESARICASLDEALAGCHMVFATSARMRDVALPEYRPREAMQCLDVNTHLPGVAFVFGREHSGLSNSEFLQANKHILIPANPAYSSLNLGQAVQIVVYELMLRLQELATAETGRVVAGKSESLAEHQDMRYLESHFWRVVEKTAFLKQANPVRIKQRFRRMFARMGLEKNEAILLRGVLTALENALK